MIAILTEDNGVSNDRKQLIVSTLLGFSNYDIVRKYFIDVISDCDSFYLKF